MLIVVKTATPITLSQYKFMALKPLGPLAQTWVSSNKVILVFSVATRSRWVSPKMTPVSYKEGRG